MARGTPWSREENEATVASYFEMMAAKLRGFDVNQAAYNRELQKLLDRRNHAAVEYKYQNISAVLIDLGVPYINGYKPAFNYQASLRPIVVEQLDSMRVLRQLVANSVEDVPSSIAKPDPVLVFTEPPPAPKRAAPRKVQPSNRAPVDYVQMEARNVALGLAGERFVVDLERELLERAGKSKLAAQVSHVSQERGDALGYDILSFDPVSREKLIEVKTTKYGEYTPFFVTQNELNVSQDNAAAYHLYRVYSFGPAAKLFAIQGALDKSLQLLPANYIARVG